MPALTKMAAQYADEQTAVPTQSQLLAGHVAGQPAGGGGGGGGKSGGGESGGDGGPAHALFPLLNSTCLLALQ